MSEVKFNQKQQAAIDSSAPSVVVSAGAGSGKTAVLTARITAKLADREHPVDIDRFLVVTYTKAAAAEMRSRISENLSELVSQNITDTAYCNQLRRQIGKLSSAKLQTVHSFCLDLVRRNCHKLDLSTVFDLCSEEELAELQTAAVTKVLEQAYEDNEEDFTLLRNAVCEERGDKNLSYAIVAVYDKLQSLPYPEKWLHEQIDAYNKGSHFLKKENDRIVAEECISLLSYAVSDMEIKLAHLNQSCPPVYTSVADNYAFCFEFADKLKDLLERHDFAQVISQIDGFKMPGAKPVKDPDKLFELEKTAAKRSKDNLTAALKNISDLLSLPESDENTSKAERYLCKLCLDYGIAFENEKKRASKLTYSDLEHFAIKLLSNEDGSPSEIAQDLSNYLVEVMVDEYQDSNEVQDTIFRLIAPKDGSSFFVGDIKQSIYRFIKANPKIFAARCKDAQSGGGDYITMNDNYRSSPEVINITNSFFTQIMTEEFGEVDYSQAGQPLISNRPTANTPCELCLQDAKVINEARKNAGLDTLSANEIEGRYVAKRIAEMLQCAKVPNKDGTMRDAKPSDFAILLSSYRGKCDAYIDALTELNIPVSAIREESDAFSSVEASVVISLLRIISNRRQDIPLLSVMRSPFFSFTSQEIAEIRAEKPRGDIWDAVMLAATSGNEKCRHFISELEHYCDAAKDISCARLLQHIYARTGAYGIFSVLPQPEERKKTLDFLYRTAVNCECGSFKSCDQLVSYIDRLSGASMPSSSAKEGVNVMTIHKSKGLEFPFVFVADQFKSFNQKELQAPTFLIDTDIGLALRCVDNKNRLRIFTKKQSLITSKTRRELRSEELRKLYVAMTRAREKLFFLITPHNSTVSSKIQNIYKAVGKLPTQQWFSEQSSAADWLLAVFMSHPGASALRAMLHGVDFGIPEDERELSCSVSLDADLPSVLPETDDGPQVYEGFHSPKNEENLKIYLDLAEQNYAYEDIAKLSSKMTPTGMGGHKHITSSIYTAQEAQDGLTAAEKGTRVHDLLAKVDLAQCRTLEGSRAQLEKFSLGGEAPDERDIEMVCSFANSPWGERVLSAKEVMHEYRFGLLFTPKELDLGDNETEQILVNGSIDLLLDEGDSLTVVDYKTDSVKPGEEKSGAEVHRRQLELYKNAAQQIFQKPVSEITVFFLKTGVGIKL